MAWKKKEKKQTCENNTCNKTKQKHLIRSSEKSFTLGKNEFNGWSYINTLKNLKTWKTQTGPSYEGIATAKENSKERHEVRYRSCKGLLFLGEEASDVRNGKRVLHRIWYLPPPPSGMPAYVWPQRSTPRRGYDLDNRWDRLSFFLWAAVWRRPSLERPGDKEEEMMKILSFPSPCRQGESHHAIHYLGM